jgi:hypothetical protein
LNTKGQRSSNSEYPPRWSRSRKVSQNHVVCAKCHLAGLASSIDWIVASASDSGAASASLSARVTA